MQRVPDAMFQALQRQGAGQEKSSRSRGPGGAEGGAESGQTSREGAGSQTRQSSFQPAYDRVYPSPSPPSTPPPFGSEAPRYSRLPRPEVPPGGRGGAGRRVGFNSFRAEVTIQAPQPIRPVSGPRALGTTSWASAAETVSPQFLGGRLEGHASFLKPNTADFAAPFEQRKSSKQQSITEKKTSPIIPAVSFSEHPADAIPAGSKSEQLARRKAPPSTDSDSSFASTSKSGSSYASSFAYLLGDRRDDLRLFKKKSKPSQHLKKASAPARPALVSRHSASYYKPKIVEDTAALLTAPPSLPALPEQSSDLRSPLPGRTPTRPPIRPVRSSPSQSTSETAPSVRPPTPRHPVVPIYRPDHNFSRPTHRPQHHHHQPEVSSASSSHSRDSSRSHSQLRPSSSAASVARRRRRPDTPPEDEPHLPFDSANKHGCHYFRTFGVDTIYQKADIEPGLSTPKDKFLRRETPESLPSPPASPSPSPSPSTSPRSPSGATRDRTKSHKRSSILGKLRHPEGTHHIFHGQRNENEESASSTPDITVSTPQLAKSRRRSTIASYFTRSHSGQRSGNATPSPAGSGLSTHWEDAVAESQPPRHAKEYSEPLSPMSIPRSARRPKPTPVQSRTPEQTREIQSEPVSSNVSVPPSTDPLATDKSPDAEGIHNVLSGDLRTLSFLPTEMRRVSTPPQSKRPKGFKNFFFDMRSMPSEPTEPEPEPPEARRDKRRGPILNPRSVQSLIIKLSLPKLNRRSSQKIDERRESDDPLAVTSFQQTPFSQRYGDARRAKMSQIRSYMEEALNEDDDDESSTYPFVLNVPDHLPNSPLCPLSPKHSSGGKAICPIHRRKRATVAMPLSRPSKVPRHGPTIVFESGEQGNGSWTPGLEDLRREYE